ncbi:MAG TPA: molybdopterin-dependent oxidoreductase [Chryseosolibacter sp.]|nr:molybdopterin-dependent oxidoreductase [Chryseosolibacter sp.]
MKKSFITSGKAGMEFKTTCCYCGVGCGIIVKKDKKNQITIEGDKDHPVNKGMLCSKGMNLHYALRDTSDRLLYPEMRWSRNHRRERVSWDTAMKRATAVFSSIIRKHGPDSVGFYVSGQCLTEEYYVANKLVKGFIGTNNIDTNSRLCMSSAVAAFNEMFGEDAVPVSYDDIEIADCFLIAGANPAWCHPILFRRIETKKQKDPNTKIIVIDPRKTQTCSLADLHLEIFPGTDVYLYQAIARVLIEEGRIDNQFIAQRTEAFEAYRDAVLGTSIEKAAEVCRVREEDIRLAASYIAKAKGFLTLWAMGLNQSVVGVKKNEALISLNLLTGHIGKPGSGPFSLTGQPNAMGGREVGGLATTLAAHKKIEDPQHRAEVAAFWRVSSLPEKRGLTAIEMIEALEAGSLKALWIVCTNPLVSWPDARRVERALENARFVVVQDISAKSDTLTFADLVLPAAGHMEKDGTMTNSERRISYLPKVIDPPGEAKPDAEILCMFAKGMGFDGFNYRSTAEIYDEHCRLTSGTNLDISGLSHARLQSEGTFQWPVPHAEHPGTARLFTDQRFYTKNGKARFAAPRHPDNLSEPTSPTFPLVLTTGRIRDQWHTMTKTGKVNKLLQHIRKPFLEIHPEDATIRGISDGDVVTVENARGDIRVCAKITSEIRPGVVFLPMHWGKMQGCDQARANNVTSMLVDPTSKEPDYKHSAVEVKRYFKPREKIVVAGAGAAAYRFLQTYRALNNDDEIVVISKETNCFYNRVLLPEYVNRHLPWTKLQKFAAGEMEALRFTLHAENEIVTIDREKKVVIDKYGHHHAYGKLILATGSRANLPHDAPAGFNNVMTMRTRDDADKLRPYLNPGAHIVIIGGGLLGLELAVSLREINVLVSILQLGSRLMERQVDHIAGQLLLDFIDEKDITVYMNDQLLRANRHTTGKLNLHLRSGRTLTADALVYAVGTRPNIEFAQEAGIEAGRGITVNDWLQTSDPDVFAIGEIAEHNGKTWGITSAAEKQADVLARFLNGDVQSAYDGAVPMNILKLPGLDLCSIGMAEVPANNTGYDEIVFVDQAMRYYKKCIIKDDRLVGAILVGDKSEFAEFKSLIENRTELSEKRMQLLRSGTKAEPVKGKLVCACNQVGEGNLNDLISNGLSTLADVCERSGAGLGCGSCKPEIQQLLARKQGWVVSEQLST